MGILSGEALKSYDVLKGTKPDSIIDFILKLLPKLSNFNTLESDQRENLEFIKLCLQKKPEFFSRFIKENTELLSGNYIEEKLDYYLDSFLNYPRLVESLKNCRLEKEKVIDNELNILFEECLYRTKNKDIQYWEILKIYTDLGRSIDIAETVSDKLFSEIESGESKGTFSFNLEVSDLMNKEFLNNFINRYLVIKESKIDCNIFIEVLENQVIEDVDKFEKILERIKDIGIAIAIDDTMQIGSHLESINEIKEILKNHNGIKVIKICGKYLQNLYKEYNSGDLNEDKLIEIQEFISNTISSGIFVVGEWIENEEIFKFARDILMVSHFQGFYFNKKE